MTEGFLRNIIEGICRAAQDQNIGSNNVTGDNCDNDTQELNRNVQYSNGSNDTDNNFNVNSFLEVRSRLSVSFEEQNPTCYICNGFYGPCFEDPLCAICHAFLYPAHSVEIPSSKYESSSDSDSGNEELDDGQESESLSTLDGSDDPSPPVYEFESLARQLHRLSVFSPQLEQINIELLPPEVLIHTFKYLDEISLWSIGQVCTRWKEILFMCIKPERWRHFTRIRWPLLPIDNFDQDWYELYTAMMLSSSCMKCIKQMAAQDLTNTNWDGNSWRRHRLKSELRAMQNDPLDGINAKPLDLTCKHWQATIEGPTGSPYEGGLFFLYIQVPPNYPLTPPIVRFITKIFHPNISRHGDIGIDSIHHNWSLALTLSKLLISIQSLLTDPFCDVCMEPDIGKIFTQNRRMFEDKAREWTVRYAMHYYLLPNDSCSSSF